MLDTLRVAFTAAVTALFVYLPRLLGALLLLLIGYFVGRLVATLVTRVLRLLRFDQLADRAQLDDLLRNAGVRMDPAAIVGELVKWFVYLIFVQAAAATLGFPQLTAILNQVVTYIPRVLVALVILLVGALAANVVGGLVRGGLAAARLGNAALLATIARWGVLAFALLAALSQLQIAPAIVNTLWYALIGGLGLGLAIAFGLGARDLAGSIATGQLIRGEIQPGMQIGVDGEGGTVEQVGALYTTLRTPSGQFKIPNAELARKSVLVAGGSAAPGADQQPQLADPTADAGESPRRPRVRRS